MDIVAFREQIAAIVAKNESRIGEESRYIEREYSIDPADKIQEAILSLENEKRLLQIGIVGRVKAGKSSLLNALLFDGKNILPKAATPMTAALTQISYGDELCAEVEFFSRNDIGEIKKDHQEYTERLNKLIDEKMNAAKSRNKLASVDLWEKSRKQAQRELGGNAGLSSAYDQYERMKSSGVAIDSLKDMDILSAKDLHSLSQQLLEYVGSKGRYMPFTKSVHIKLPQENLQGIQIVDTPGLNDPVQSREDRTRELLKYCDVIFIVSPSGQFLSKEDTDLMDRITTREGVNNIFVISSQIDNQLMGDEKDKGKGDLHQILKNITKKLGEHLSTTLTQLKKNSPEVGTTFDQLIEQGQKCVIHSSGICQTLRNQFDSKELWDSGAITVWKNLTQNYPDYFSDSDKATSIANLDLLSNLGEINKIIAAIQVKKQEIFEKRKEEFVKARFGFILKYQEHLISFCRERVDEIKNNDKETLEYKKKNLEDVIEAVSQDVDDEYLDIVESFEFKLKDRLNKKLEQYFQGAKNSIDSASETESESYKVKKDGLISKGARFFGLGGYETQTRTYTTIRSGAVRNALEELTTEIESFIKDESRLFIIHWKKSELLPKIMLTLRSGANDEKLSARLVNKSIRRVVLSMNISDLVYSGCIPDTLRARGTLTKSSAELFIEDAQTYVSGLKRRVNGDVNNYIGSLIACLRENKSFSSEIFGKYKEQIIEMESQIKNKEVELDSFDRIIKELKGIY